MIHTVAEAVREALFLRGRGEMWWGAQILDAWPRVVDARVAARAEPLLEKSSLQERGLLVIAVSSSTWIHELSMLGIADRLNREIGEKLVCQVRYDLRGAV